MNIEIEDIDSCTKRIKFAIPHPDYQEKVKAYYKSLGREVKIPGFRKGKAPMAMLEKRFGPEVKKEVLTSMISDGVAVAIEEKGLRAISTPTLLEVEAEEGTDISVSASVEVLPPFEIKDYKDIEVELQVPRVTDEEVNEVIEMYRGRQGKMVQVTDRPVRDKDFVKADLIGTLNGEKFKDGVAKDVTLQVGTKMLMEGIENGLLGMQVDEEKDIEVDVPETFSNPDIAGKKVVFHAVIKGIQEKQLPELDDTFAQSADPNKKFENLEDMKNKIRKDLETHARTEGRKDAKKRLADQITEMNPIEIPEKLIEEQARFMIREEEKKREKESSSGAGHTHDSGAEHDHSAPVSAAELEKHREPAVKILQQEFLMDRLATDLEIEVSPDEVNAEINNFVRMLGGGDAKKMKADWEKSGTLVRLKNRMRRDKTLELLLDRVKIKEEIVDRKEIIANN